MPNLTEMIKAKSNERINNQNAYESNLKAGFISLRDSLLKNYGERVTKMLNIMKAIRDNDPLLWKLIKPEKFIGTSTYTDLQKLPYYFYTNGIHHHLGFFRNLEAIGYEAGGCCGDINFSIDGTTCVFETRTSSEYPYVNEFSRKCAKDFAKEFDAFEEKFKAFINAQYGENAYDSYSED